MALCKLINRCICKVFWTLSQSDSPYLDRTSQCLSTMRKCSSTTLKITKWNTIWRGIRVRKRLGRGYLSWVRSLILLQYISNLYIAQKIPKTRHYSTSMKFIFTMTYQNHKFTKIFKWVILMIRRMTNLKCRDLVSQFREQIYCMVKVSKESLSYSAASMKFIRHLKEGEDLKVSNNLQKRS